MFSSVCITFGLLGFGVAVHVKRSSQAPTVEVGLIDRLCQKHQDKFEAGGRCSLQISEDSPNLCDVTGMCRRDHTMYERCQMPQLPEKPRANQSPSENHTKWLAALDQAGIEPIESDEQVSKFIESIWPSQARIDECRTCKVVLDARRCFTKDGRFPTHDQCSANNDAWAQKVLGATKSFEEGVDSRCFCSWDSDITVMEDGQILDGHHRYAATWLLLHDAATPDTFRAQARSYAERLVRRKTGDAIQDVKTEPLGVDGLLEVAREAHRKNPVNCQVPTNPDQAVCFQPCGQAFLQQTL